jgi:hypothetical protein
LTILGVIGLLVVLFILAFVLWSVFDVYLNYGTVSIDKVIKDFKREFLGFLAVIMAAAICIPIIDWRLRKKILVESTE